MTSQTAGRMRRMPNAARAELANSPVREGARSPVNGNNDDKRDASVTVRKHPFHLSLAIEAIHGERNTGPVHERQGDDVRWVDAPFAQQQKSARGGEKRRLAEPGSFVRLAKKVDRHDPEHADAEKSKK